MSSAMDSNISQKVNLPNSIVLTRRGQKHKDAQDSGNVTFEEALSVVNEMVFAKTGKHLNKPEIDVMRGAWHDKDYGEIASDSIYKLNYLQRVVGARLWDTLSDVLGNGERVTKKRLRECLEQVVQEHYLQYVANSINKGQIKGRNLPDFSSFYGRTKELASLKEIVFKQRCVLLLGVAGIGKSTLAAKLLAEFSLESEPQFDCLIWKSVSHAPLFQDFVLDLLEILQPSKLSDSDLPKYTQAMITMLIKQLQSRRCLLVLDEYDSLFKAIGLEQRLEYSLFFRRFIEELDQGCLLLTSRFLTGDIENMLITEKPIDCLKLEGLDTDAAINFLNTQGLHDKEKISDLVETYRANPGEMKAVINRINHFFGGDSETFFEHKTTLISSRFEAMLNEMFGQLLSDLQRQILIYLAERIALTSQSVQFTQLLSDPKFKNNVSGSTLEVIRALEQLESMSLIESNKNADTKAITFTLQPVIKKYITTDPLGLVHVADTSTLKFAS
ncbi:MAG: NACHT domain-containing protein [Mojavia pulchra JT2-VF2]|jgi:hypothetical protein|uniref:NACHT domain-containing protein n=1 Tax=Mojavia pulchra JT2-VF2 TaxID=287848 RepID=A0A951Q610_9NOST|nr:NACHT domain-containing protein [Mojavia pulchra JT2-VF2]